MRDAPETRCPLCEQARPPHINRCRCGYTFEYDRTAGGGGAISAGTRGGLIAIALAAAAVAGYFALDVNPRDNLRPELDALLIASGVFAFVGAWFGWEWFLGARRARLVQAVLGTTGARYFYALLGGAFVGGGMGLLLAAPPR